MLRRSTKLIRDPGGERAPGRRVNQHPPGAAWVDEHPDRFMEIREGDYVGIRLNEGVHFVRCLQGPYGIGVVRETACGLSLPVDKFGVIGGGHPICGVVDCADCLEAMERVKPPGQGRSGPSPT
jgi:hypothetical protein